VSRQSYQFLQDLWGKIKKILRKQQFYKTKMTKLGFLPSDVLVLKIILQFA
jgi:hypothetical protein